MLKYLQFNLAIIFERPVFFNIHPIFLFRSVFGMQLRNLVCLFKKRNCSECLLKMDCVYAKIFETLLDKNNPILPENDRAPHPFVIYTEAGENVKTDKINLELTLIGESIKYLPYFYHSLVKAGTQGIERERIKFEVVDLTLDGSSILSGENIKMPDKTKVFKVNLSDDKVNRSIKVNLKTPFRLKKNGRFVSDFEAIDFLQASYRRLFILNSLY